MTEYHNAHVQGRDYPLSMFTAYWCTLAWLLVHPDAIAPAPQGTDCGDAEWDFLSECTKAGVVFW